MREKTINIFKNPFWMLYATLFLIYASAPAGTAKYLDVFRSAVLLISALEIVYCFFMKPRIFLNKPTVSLLVLAAVCMITIVIHRGQNFVDNVSCVVFLTLGSTLFLNQTYGKMKEAVDREMLFITKLNVYFPMLYAIIAIGLLVFDVTIILGKPEERIVIGIYENRLWGLYNANKAGAICMFSIWSSIYLLYKKEKKRILIINIILQFFYLVLTGSRGAWYSFLFSMVILIVFVFIGIERIKKASVLGKLKCLIAGAICLFAIVLAAEVVQTVAPYMVLTGEKSSTDSGHSKKRIDFSKRVEKFDDDDFESVSNGRLDLWKAGMKVWKKAPFFGVGIGSIYENGKGYLSKKGALSLKGGILHNIILTTLVGTGIVGILALAAFLIILAVRCIKVLFCSDNKFLHILCAEIAGMMLLNMVENNILFWNCEQAVVFWYVCSYFLYYTDKNNIQESLR